VESGQFKGDGSISSPQGSTGNPGSRRTIMRYPSARRESSCFAVFSSRRSSGQGWLQWRAVPQTGTRPISSSLFRGGLGSPDRTGRIRDGNCRPASLRRGGRFCRNRPGDGSRRGRRAFAGGRQRSERDGTLAHRRARRLLRGLGFRNCSRWLLERALIDLLGSPGLEGGGAARVRNCHHRGGSRKRRHWEGQWRGALHRVTGDWLLEARKNVWYVRASAGLANGRTGWHPGAA